MSGKLTLSIAALLTGVNMASARPTEGGTALAEACKGRDGWSDAAPPTRIHGNTYYVGTCGITVLLVTGRSGHVLIDGATAMAVPSILANIRSLGFDPRDIHVIVGSHEHVDHMGGFAALKAATDARLLVRAPARTVLESGHTADTDPQAGAIDDMIPVGVNGVLADARPVRVGRISITPVATPGHTSGGTSWSWRSCEASACVSFAYVDSMTAVSRVGYRFADHTERVAPFRATFARVAALPCDILVTPHPSASNLFDRLAGRAALVDATACKTLAAAMGDRLDKRLTDESAP